MPETAQFTAAEAAFVLRQPVRTVRKALDSGPVRATLAAPAGIRTITWPDLLYLFAERSLRDDLTPKARSAFYEALHRDQPQRDRDVQFGRFRIAVADLMDEVQARTASLADLIDKVEFREDGEALLKGRDVEVHRIAALLDGGLKREDILADYPSLTAAEIDSAHAYAQAHPKSGRPYPRTTLKRAVHGAGLEALDEVHGPTG